MSPHPVEFSGVKGRFFAWFLTSPFRRVLEWRMGVPEPRLLELLALEGGEVVVDAGCGSGFHTLLIAERLPTGRVVGVDVSAEMIDRLRRSAERRGLSGRVEAVVGDALALPVPDGSADRAISAAAWHHLDDPQAACRELVRVLRPGGRVVVIDLRVDAHRPAAPLPGHDRAFGEEDLSRILGASGLEEGRVEGVGRWLIGSGVKPR